MVGFSCENNGSGLKLVVQFGAERLRKALVASGSVCLLCCGVWHRLLPNKVVSKLKLRSKITCIRRTASETKANGMKEEDWTLLGVVRLSLAKNAAFNIVNEKTTFGLLKDLPNMYEKSSASNKVFLIRQLVNTKMTEGAAIADHVNKFNSVISKLLSRLVVRRIGIKKEITIGEHWEHHVLEMWAKGKEYCESRVMDPGASFHATSCMGLMKNFKPLIGKVHLADMKVLDVAGIRDVVLKTTFGTEWILKNVRYIPTLKRKLIYVGQLDNEGYHIGFCDQKWKVTRGSRVIARGCKRGTLIWQLSVRLRKRLRVKLCNRLRRQICAPQAEQREKSTWEPIRLDLVSPGLLSIIVESLGTSKGLGTKGSVKASGSMGASGSSVNRLSLYVCTDLWQQAMVEMSSLGENQTGFLGQVTSRKAKEGLLIVGKEDLAYVETLYRWAVGSVRLWEPLSALLWCLASFIAQQAACSKLCGVDSDLMDLV
nr:retrovirus-related Pol polyprotein from transposon TNT 1-94 [Tanacetum cinerariifolium]